MTSIMNYEEHMKSSDRVSDVIFNSINRFYDAKISGALKSDELAKIIILEGQIFANQIRNGKVTEEQIEDFETQIPNGKYDCFDLKHENLQVAYQDVIQGNTAILYEREQRYSQPVKRM